MADLDGDGRLDFVNGLYVPANVYWFRRTADGVAPRELLLEAPAESKLSMATANAADLDGDGLVDLVIGDTSGKVLWSRNEGAVKEPKFGPCVPLRAGDAELKVSHKSDPMPVDWDGDGRLDLLVGDECADVGFFRGREDRTFEPGVSLFSGLTVDPKDGYQKAVAKYEPHRAIPGYRVRLAVDDWNCDGKLDLLAGNCVTEKAADGGKRSRTVGHVWVLLRR